MHCILCNAEPHARLLQYGRAASSNNLLAVPQSRHLAPHLHSCPQHMSCFQCTLLRPGCTLTVCSLVRRRSDRRHSYTAPSAPALSSRESSGSHAMARTLAPCPLHSRLPVSAWWGMIKPIKLGNLERPRT